MALADVYPLAFLSDLLRHQSLTLDLLRFDEQSGSGDGRFWAARLATPLWQVTAPMIVRDRFAAAEISAKIRALDGMRRQFLFEDKSYSPASGGVPGSSVKIASISADRTAIALNSLPAGYRVTAGDRMSIAWGSGRYFFAEFAETVTANGSGVTAQIAIMPYLPQSIATGAAVELARPRLKAIVPPGGFTPFTDIPGRLSQGASLILLQKT